MTDEIKHYGIKMRSGRYPWGSGENPQRSQDLLGAIKELRSQGLSETEVSKALGMNTQEMRSAIAWANSVRKQARLDQIKTLRDRGITSPTEIAKSLGVTEGAVRNYMKQMSSKDKVEANQTDAILERLKDEVEKNKYVDVGAGVQVSLGVSKDKLKKTIKMLEQQGYYVHNIYVKRLNDPTKTITVKTISKEPDYKVVRDHSDEIRTPDGWTDDNGLTWQNMQPPKSVSSDRVEVKYGPEGGADKDGVIELRRGVSDLDLGDSKYAQVRIKVDDSHYLKGMVMYSDDLPPGVDLRFNTNKDASVGKLGAMKKLTGNPENEFGSYIQRQKGALNIVNEEGDWDEWKSKLSAQFLSKQPLSLVKDRINATKSQIDVEHDEIQAVNNPIVQKHLLEAFSDGLESKARHLKVQGLPRTKGQVLLPFPNMKTDEVYAPNYNDGETVVLIRYPHGGTFELPQLKVNNKNPEAKKTLGMAQDAIGIHPSVAEKMSGADFDGDTVYVVPNPKGQVKVSRSLKALETFDPNIYKVDHPTISGDTKQTQMGIVSNLITDMTIKGAPQSEIANAVKHSMVVIDSEKHQLDWKQSARDNRISALQKKYQTHISKIDGKEHTAASTLISTSKQEIKVGGQEITFINPETGRKNKKTVGSTKMPIINAVTDANDLTSGTAVEKVYADYINDLKTMRDSTAKQAASIKPIKKNNDAAKEYKPQVEALREKLNVALANAPRERQAQVQAANTYYRNLDYDMDRSEKKKLKRIALEGARKKINPDGKTNVTITEKEWEAIQKGAISNNMLEEILRNTDMEAVKKLATPRDNTVVATPKLSRAVSLLNNGYTPAEAAAAVGVSVNVLREHIDGL